MYIKTIQHYSKEDNEADVIVSDGLYDILCYYAPAPMIQTNQIVRSILSFLCTDICRSKEGLERIIKLDGYYAYELTGVLISKHDCLLRIGGLVIELDGYIPGDVSENEYISCCVQRLDVMT